MNNISLFEAARLLLSRDNYRILIHRHPDGDAAGSAEALRLILKALDKKAEILCPDELPEYLSFLCEEETFFSATQPMPENRGKNAQEQHTAVYISVDVAEPKLLEGLYEKANGKILLKLDHHRTGEDFALYNYTDPDASAAGEIVYELSKLLDVSSKEISAALYAAIASDTGCFRYSNTTARTLEIAAELYKSGIDTAALNTALFESKDLKTVKATAMGIEHTRFFMNNRAALLCFTAEMRTKGEFSSEHLSELSSALREIRGVELTAVLLQNPTDPKSFRLSTRSKSFFDCSALCAFFEGGGHLRASGGTVHADSPDEALKKVKEKMKELWKN